MSGIERLKKRAEFVRAARGRKWNTEHFLLQIQIRAPVDEAPPRFGFTVTNKVGRAVVRNRIRRRLREAVRMTAPMAAPCGHDYVLIGRRSAIKAPFARIAADLEEALRRTGKSKAVGNTEPGNG